MNTLVRKRPRRELEAAEYLGMTRRVIRAAGRRVGQSDVEQLPALLALGDLVDDAVRHAIGELRASGATWEQIGAELGVTRQAALMRWAPR